MLPPMDDDMHFGGADFTQPDMNVPDGMLDVADGQDQFTFDITQLGLPGAEIEAPLPDDIQADPDQVSQNVEHVMLKMIGGGGHDTVMQMAGERPASTATASRTAGLRMAYAAAVRHNPALRWYPKLASLLPPEKFGIVQGSLQIAMPEAMFRKVVLPFMHEFRADWSGHSTMVDAVRSMAAALAVRDRAATHRHMAGGVRRQSNVEATDLDIAGLGMGEGQVADLPQTVEGEPVEPMRPRGQAPAPAPTPAPAVPRLPISLSDLSMKAVVDHIAGMDGSDDDDAMMGTLLDNGFSRAKANEILAMLRYKRVTEARRASLYSPEGNRGTGSIEFGFR